MTNTIKTIKIDKKTQKKPFQNSINKIENFQKNPKFSNFSVKPKKNKIRKSNVEVKFDKIVKNSQIKEN